MTSSRSVSLNSFTLNGARVHQVFYAGMPLAPEDTDRDHAETLARTMLASVRKQFGRCALVAWDGDTDETTELETA